MKQNTVLFSITLIALLFGITAKAETPEWCAVVENTLHKVYRSYNIDDPTHAGYAVRDFEAAISLIPGNIKKEVFGGIVRNDGGENYEVIRLQDLARGYSEAFQKILETTCKKKETLLMQEITRI